MRRDTGDVWDSGKVPGDESVNVEYRGKPLNPAQTVFWKVRIWDENDQPSDWSGPARWTAGLFNSSNWTGQWIGYDGKPSGDPFEDKLRELSSLKDAKWVWVHGARAGNQAPGDAYFRKSFEIRRDAKISKAVFTLTVDDAFTLYVNGREVGQGTSWRTLSKVDLAAQLTPGANVLGIKATNGGSNPSPAGLLGKLVVLYADGQSQVIPVDSTWETSTTLSEGWNLPGFDSSKWQGASEIAKFGDQPWGEIQSSEQRMLPAVYLRKPFKVEKPLKRAVVFASALG
ncbi:MAG: hypothetical protein N3G20_11115, partial [Verrucomicrobiae bacterium]|nr:hypothetical protein [Verrucomicrobiae bacterium]